MTTTVQNPRTRTGPELIHVIAGQIRSGHHMHDAIANALHGEHHDRYVNLVADLATALHLVDGINRFDLDHLADPNAADPLQRGDHPASYATRLDIWQAMNRDPAYAAATLDSVADLMRIELAAATADLVGGVR